MSEPDDFKFEWNAAIFIVLLFLLFTFVPYTLFQNYERRVAEKECSISCKTAKSKIIDEWCTCLTEDGWEFTK